MKISDSGDNNEIVTANMYCCFMMLPKCSYEYHQNELIIKSGLIKTQLLDEKIKI